MKKLIPVIIVVIIMAIVAIILILNNANNANNIDDAKKDPINSTSGEIIEVTNNTSGEENKEDNKNTLEDYLNDQVWLSDNLFIASGQCDVGLTQPQQVYFIKTSDDAGFIKVEATEEYGIDMNFLIGMDNGSIKITNLECKDNDGNSYNFTYSDCTYDVDKDVFYYSFIGEDGGTGYIYFKEDCIFSIDGFDINILKSVVFDSGDNWEEKNKEVEQMLEGYDFKKINNKLCTIYYPEIYKKDSKYDFLEKIKDYLHDFKGLTEIELELLENDYLKRDYLSYLDNFVNGGNYNNVGKSTQFEIDKSNLDKKQPVKENNIINSGVFSKYFINGASLDQGDNSDSKVAELIANLNKNGIDSLNDLFAIQNYIIQKPEYSKSENGEDYFFDYYELLIINGNIDSEYSFKNNARAKKIKLTINDGEFVKEYDLEDSYEYQELEVGYKTNDITKPIKTEIEVLEYYPGEKTNDVYIGVAVPKISSNISEPI